MKYLVIDSGNYDEDVRGRPEISYIFESIEEVISFLQEVADNEIYTIDAEREIENFLIYELDLGNKTFVPVRNIHLEDLY